MTQEMRAYTRSTRASEWVKYRVVILGSLAEAWHCSREYRVERRLPGASSHTNPSPRFKLRSILALVHVRLSLSSSLFLVPLLILFQCVTSSSLSFTTRLRACFSPSLLNLLLFFRFPFCFCPPWLLKLPSASLSVFISAACPFLFFVPASLFLTRYIFKCVLFV